MVGLTRLPGVFHLELMTLKLMHISWMLDLRLVQASLALAHPHTAPDFGAVIPSTGVM